MPSEAGFSRPLPGWFATSITLALGLLGGLCYVLWQNGELWFFTH